MQGVRSENCGRPWPHEWEGPADRMSVGGTENRRFGGFSEPNYGRGVTRNVHGFSLILPSVVSSEAGTESGTNLVNGIVGYLFGDEGSAALTDGGGSAACGGPDGQPGALRLHQSAPEEYGGGLRTLPQDPRLRTQPRAVRCLAADAAPAVPVSAVQQGAGPDVPGAGHRRGR